MLLARDQWASLAGSSSISVPDEPYVFCYFMGKNAWNRECAQELAEQHNLKIVAIAHPDEYVKADDDYADYYPWDAGPAGVGQSDCPCFVCLYSTLSTEACSQIF